MTKRATGLIVALMLIPVPAGAANEALIAELLAKVQALQSMISLLQAGSGCTAPTQQLSQGARGNEVRMLQSILSRDVMIYPEKEVTGYYGILTFLAVGRFQEKYLGVGPVTPGFGNVGPRTLAVIRKQANCPDQAPAGGQTANSTPATTVTQTTPRMTIPIPPPTSLNINATPTQASTSTTSPVVHLHVIVPASQSITITGISPQRPTLGGSLTIGWRATGALPGASVALSVQNASTGATLGTIANGLPTVGSYSWTIPVSNSSTTCNINPLNCIQQFAIAGCATGSVCSVVPGNYRIVAKLAYPNSTSAIGQSAVFAIDPTSASTINLAPTTPNPNATSTFMSIYLQMTANTSQVTSTPGATCTYSSVQYIEGISLTVNCADLRAPLTACNAQYNDLLLTCRAGSWVREDGTVALIPNVTTGGTGPGCTTPWQSLFIASGNQIPYYPFFTNGVYSMDFRVPIMECNNGTWQMCDHFGAYCAAYTPITQ